MSKKKTIRIVVDVLMTLTLLFLMPYSLIGTLPHEILGIGMLALFVVHHVLNRRWMAALFHGRYNAMRVLQTVTAAAMLLCMAGSAVSGVMLSRHVFRFLGLRAGSEFFRHLHMFSAYWGFVCMSAHLGLHWNGMLRIAGRRIGAKGWALRSAGVAVAGYGVYAFIRRGFAGYLFLTTPFAFFDFSEPIIFFIFDYMAVMGTFVWFGHYTAKLLKH